MALSTSLNRILPQRFMGVIPLFIGIEIILGIAILNKAGGIYGILSIFTGHPINFWQWLYNVLSIFTLPFYISALINLKTRPKNARKMSLASIIYTIDTIIGLLYTIYFIYFWFSSEDVKSNSLDYAKRAVGNDYAADQDYGLPVTTTSKTTTPDLSSQSASLVRELYVTFATTIAITAIRIYFNLVFVSFTKALLKQDLSDRKYNERLTGDDDDEVEILGATGILAGVHRFIYDLERRSKDYLNVLFN
ncbi:Inositolphosphorylceramide synthase subunit Kei1-domain-containing protein [Scheffersomyces coipomensis]|uniref:Inositolphosphorylceramide synthase subunit Kei1-domain-containing protein n=1 Tax=Scheffersomyces coipomensis TaxID=1788519 RepID=UPI00315D546A